MGTSRQELLDQCLRCQSPQGDEIRHAVAQGHEFDDQQVTPVGRPLLCCHVRAVTSIIRDPAAPTSAEAVFGGMVHGSSFGARRRR
jgi:hypothetical protein